MRRLTTFVFKVWIHSVSLRKVTARLCNLLVKHNCTVGLDNLCKLDTSQVAQGDLLSILEKGRNVN